MRILITGSRHWSDREVIETAIRYVAADLIPETVTVVHGAAKGADTLAGAVAEYLDWRWAFLGVAVLTAAAFLMIAVRLRGVDLGRGTPQDRKTLIVRLVLAVVVAVLAVVVGFSADLQPSMRWPVALGAVLAIGFAVMPLLPRRTLRAGAGLPSVVLMRGIVAGAFFAAEAYIPYLLMKKFDFTATWAGIELV